MGTDDSKQNIMLWMDHRATEEANFINSKKNKVLKYVGNKISPEMEPPKLLWLKKVYCKYSYFYTFTKFTEIQTKHSIFPPLLNFDNNKIIHFSIVFLQLILE